MTRNAGTTERKETFEPMEKAATFLTAVDFTCRARCWNVRQDVSQFTLCIIVSMPTNAHDELCDEDGCSATDYDDDDTTLPPHRYAKTDALYFKLSDQMLILSINPC